MEVLMLWMVARLILFYVRVCMFVCDWLSTCIAAAAAAGARDTERGGCLGKMCQQVFSPSCVCVCVMEGEGKGRNNEW